MEEQRNQYIGVGAYERDENRVSSRNGYYDREYTTRIGSLTLRVPRTRDGLFSTDIFDRYQRHEKALLAAMLERYISGVSMWEKHLQIIYFQPHKRIRRYRRKLEKCSL